MAFLDKLARPHNFRRLIVLFISLVAIAIMLGTFALVRELRTASDVDRVTERIERPTPAQVRAGLDRAIKGLSTRQRRELLDRLLQSATLEQLKRIRTRAKVATRKMAQQARRGAARRSPPPVTMRRTPPVSARLKPPPRSSPPAPPPAPPPAAGIPTPLVPLPPAPPPRTPAAPQAANEATAPKPGKPGKPKGGSPGRAADTRSVEPDHPGNGNARGHSK